MISVFCILRCYDMKPNTITLPETFITDRTTFRTFYFIFNRGVRLRNDLVFHFFQSLYISFRLICVILWLQRIKTNLSFEKGSLTVTPFLKKRELIFGFFKKSIVKTWDWNVSLLLGNETCITSLKENFPFMYRGISFWGF